MSASVLRCACNTIVCSVHSFIQSESSFQKDLATEISKGKTVTVYKNQSHQYIRPVPLVNSKTIFFFKVKSICSSHPTHIIIQYSLNVYAKLFVSTVCSLGCQRGCYTLSSLNIKKNTTWLTQDPYGRQTL